MRCAAAPSAGPADPRSRFPPAPVLLENEVHVILVDLAEIDVATLASILDTEERRRAANLRRPDDRERYIALHVAFREVVGAVLHRSPAEVQWAMGRNNKPLVAGSTLGVNVSRSGERAAIALAWRRDVGVDIEQVREVDELELAAVVFSPAEQRELRSYHDAGRRDAFYRVWVAKEALLKARGDGLGGPLTAFDVSAEPDGEEALIASRLGGERSWSIHRIDAGRDHAAAIAASSPPWHSVVWAGIERPIRAR